MFHIDHLIDFTADGPGDHQPLNDPWTLMAAVAARTERLTLGSYVTPIPRRQPWQLARDLTTLDRLSDGRVILGAGLGAPWDFEAFGEVYDQSRLAERYDEALDVITGLWTGEPFSYDGEHYTVDEAVLRPTPVQEPRIPIVIGGVWPSKKPFNRGAQWDGIVPHYRGDGVIPAEGLDRDDTGDLDVPERPGDPEAEVRELVEYYRGRAAEPGEVLVPADPPHADGAWLAFCRDLGATWVYTRNIDPEDGWELNLELVRRGPPG